MTSYAKCLVSGVVGAFVGMAAMHAAHAPASAAQDPAEKPAPKERAEVVVDDSRVVAEYANFVRVTATPEEAILDFGLNPQPFAVGRQDVKADRRMVMNFYTAKRLLTALGMTIQRHEATFGKIELDVRRRAALANPTKTGQDDDKPEK